MAESCLHFVSSCLHSHNDNVKKLLTLFTDSFFDCSFPAGFGGAGTSKKIAGEKHEVRSVPLCGEGAKAQ